MIRIIKRYPNRKLYDMTGSCYISLKDIERFTRLGEDIQIIDTKTGEDITRQVLMQIISRMPEHEQVPVSNLQSLIAEGGKAFKQFIAKTVQYGRELTTKTTTGERDTNSSEDKSQDAVKPGFSLDNVKRSAENLSEKILSTFNNRLRTQLLHIPTQEDWRRLNDKLDLLDKHLKKLSETRED